MSVWDTYENRADVHGKTRRDVSYIRETRMIDMKLPDNLSYQEVDIDGIDRTIAVINSDNLNEKNIYSMPGEDIPHGGLVSWMGNKWLITERDANTTVYTRAKMIQCNHLLKWIEEDGTLYEQWCIVEDGTKYLTGEYEDRNFIATRGDTRISVTLARNENTVKLGRTRRFLIDDDDAEVKLAYQLTKPLRLGWAYNNQGIYKFVLQEVNSTEFDNHELGIADYYRYFPKETIVSNDVNFPPLIGGMPEKDGKKVWL